ncbi:TPA: DUF3487 family protein [Vibrio vulnificus]|nr:DUF3487 family protein [Vibrio vulnificus]
MKRPNFVPSAIDSEPAAYLGLSLQEFLTVSLTRVTGGLVFGLVVSLLIYPHYIVALISAVAGMAIGVVLVKLKAKKILIEGRGKDPFYGMHSSKVKFERIKIQLFGRKKSGFYYEIEDRKWGRR